MGTVPVLNMLASLCIVGFLFSFSQSASIPYFYFSAPDNADVNTAAKPGQETLFVDHLLKKIEEINKLRYRRDYPPSLRLKRTTSEDGLMPRLPWDLVSAFVSPTIRGKKTTLNLPWQMALNSPMLRG